MAPEQFLRRPTDARTDQFSFCVSLHEALYGERPFPSGSLSTLFEAVVAGRVREPAQKGRVPSFLRKLLLRGLSAEPGARFPSMKALLESLRYNPVRRRRNLGIGAAAAALPWRRWWAGSASRRAGSGSAAAAGEAGGNLGARRRRRTAERHPPGVPRHGTRLRGRHLEPRLRAARRLRSPVDVDVHRRLRGHPRPR